MKVRNLKRAKLANIAKTVRLTLRFDGALCALLRGMTAAERERFILAALRQPHPQSPA